jgi:hypothetical protein
MARTRQNQHQQPNPRCHKTGAGPHGLSGRGPAVGSAREATARCPTEPVVRPVTSAPRGPARGSPGRCSRPPRAARRVVLVQRGTDWLCGFDPNRDVRIAHIGGVVPPEEGVVDRDRSRDEGNPIRLPAVALFCPGATPVSGWKTARRALGAPGVVFGGNWIDPPTAEPCASAARCSRAWSAPPV